MTYKHKQHTTYHPKNEHVDSFFVYGLSVCFVIVVSILGMFTVPITEQRIAVMEKVPLVAPGSIFDSSLFKDVEISGKAYVVYDLLTHEIIASKNGDTVLPLASITKVMTAVSSMLHKNGDEKIIISPKSIDGGFDLGLKNKQVWSLSELLKYTLIFSSNDGAEIIADNFGGKSIFLKQMNDDAKSLGLDLYFTDPAGLDVDGQIGGKGTAVEAAKLFGIARKNIPEILDATTKKRYTALASTGRISGIPNTNQEIETLPGAEASKTGFTDMAGGNLGVVVDVSVGHPVAIVVLGSTREGRFKDVDKLYMILRKSLKSN